MAATGLNSLDLWQNAVSRLDPEIKAKLNLVRSDRNDIVSATLQTVEDKRQLSYKRRWKLRIDRAAKKLSYETCLRRRPHGFDASKTLAI